MGRGARANMSGMDDVVWLVGMAKEIGVLEEHLEPIEAFVEETWPGGLEPEVIALVRSRAGDADAAGQGLGHPQRFDDEQAARQAAIALAVQD
jgi:hypothetical protein